MNHSLSSLLDWLHPINPLRGDWIESCEGLFEVDYEKTPPNERRIGVFPDVLESYHVDKRHWKEGIKKEVIEKCFEEFRFIIDTKPGCYDHFQYTSTTLKHDYPIETGLFWRVLCRKQDAIKPELVRDLEMPEGFDDYEKRCWEVTVRRGVLPRIEKVQDLATTLKEKVLNRVYKEMKASFEEGENWVFNPLYEQKLRDKKVELEDKRNTQVKKYTVLSFFAALGVFFFSPSQGV